MVVLTKSERRALIIIALILLISLLVQWLQPHQINSKIYDYTMQDSLFKALSADTILAAGQELSFADQKKPLKSTRPVKAKKQILKPKSININSATEKELTQLPRIGLATAKLIIEYRTTNGSFGSIEELLNVKRIGPKTLEQIAPYIFVEGDSSQYTDH